MKKRSKPKPHTPMPDISLTEIEQRHTPEAVASLAKFLDGQTCGEADDGSTLVYKRDEDALLRRLSARIRQSRMGGRSDTRHAVEKDCTASRWRRRLVLQLYDEAANADGQAQCPVPDHERTILILDSTAKEE